MFLWVCSVDVLLWLFLFIKVPTNKKKIDEHKLNIHENNSLNVIMKIEVKTCKNLLPVIVYVIRSVSNYDSWIYALENIFLRCVLVPFLIEQDSQWMLDELVIFFCFWFRWGATWTTKDGGTSPSQSMLFPERQLVGTFSLL